MTTNFSPFFRGSGGLTNPHYRIELCGGHEEPRGKRVGSIKSIGSIVTTVALG